MLNWLVLSACLTSSAIALPILSGTVRDISKGPIDGAAITVWTPATGTGVRTLSSMGSFSLTGLAEGEYLFKVEKDGQLPVLGAFHLAIDGPLNLNVVMRIATPQDIGAAGAASPLRDAVRPVRSSAKPPKVRPAQVKQKVRPAYPEAERNAGVVGTVEIAMIILPDGSVNDLVVLSAPNGNLALAALLAVRHWRYSPTYLDNQPVEASLTVDVKFEKQ
jgi:TonB family protein